MKLLELARAQAFWCMDILKGGYVKKALQPLIAIGDGIWSEEQITGYQQDCLQKLLTHAKETVPFYRNQSDIDLNHWPVVNKNTLRENADKAISNLYDKQKLIRMSTSGSTGTPFVSWQDVGKKKYVNAETLYYNGKIGFSIGRRIIYLRSIVGEVQKSKLQQFSQNIILLDCKDLSDEGIKEKLKLIAQYSKGCGAMMMGYASTLEAFRRYFDKYGYKEAEDANLYGIVSGSEMLYDSTRESMEKAFHCECVSRYANEENGFLGQDGIENNVFEINRADYFVEILKMDEDIPALPGEIGRIVITDFFNYAMPMIRYDTGDVGAIVKISDGRKEYQAIGSFGGRSVDTVTDCHGNYVSPHAITNMMWSHQQVKQFQFVQNDIGRYTIRLNVDPKQVDEGTLISGYRNIFGMEAEFRIEYCDEIPVLNSSKRRYIVNEIN